MYTHEYTIPTDLSICSRVHVHSSPNRSWDPSCEFEASIALLGTLDAKLVERVASASLIHSPSQSRHIFYSIQNHAAIEASVIKEAVGSLPNYKNASATLVAIPDTKTENGFCD